METGRDGPCRSPTWMRSRSESSVMAVEGVHIYKRGLRLYLPFLEQRGLFERFCMEDGRQNVCLLQPFHLPWASGDRLRKHVDPEWSSGTPSDTRRCSNWPTAGFFYYEERFFFMRSSI